MRLTKKDISRSCTFAGADGRKYRGIVVRVKNGVAVINYDVPGVGTVTAHLDSTSHSRVSFGYDPEIKNAGVPERVGCRPRQCVCHDDASWIDPASYPTGCSLCGCRRSDIIPSPASRSPS